MDRPTDTRDAARRRAQNHFSASEERDSAIRQELERERAAMNARIAKQRAARLAKEADDRLAAEAMGALFPAAPKKTRRNRKTPA